MSCMTREFQKTVETHLVSNEKHKGQREEDLFIYGDVKEAVSKLVVRNSKIEHGK